MDKQILTKELSDIGIKAKSIVFNSTGYVINGRIDSSFKLSLEDFGEMSIDGFELIRVEEVNRLMRRLVLLPASEKEFKDYIRRYYKTYNLREEFALLDLTYLVEKYGSAEARSNLNIYKSTMIRRLSNENR